MVVRDDHSQAVLLPVCDLICSRDPIVTGDDRVHAVVQRTVDKIDIEAISVLDPVRNVCVHVSSQPGQPFLQDIRRIHPVNVVVPDDADLLLFLDLLRQDLHCLIHILHQHPIVQICDRAV